MTAKLFESDADPAHGSVLVVHGLNNKPEVMDSLIDVLVSAGFHCLRVSLYPDSPRGRPESKAIEAGWRDILANAYMEILDGFPELPMYNLSYSLGALNTVSFLDQEAAPTFKRMVLIAPPVALTRGASLVRMLTPLARFGVAIPSAAPAKIRARRGTPLAEYSALLTLVDEIDTLSRPEKLGRIPTAVYLDRDDELVSDGGVLDWMKRNGLKSWVPMEFKDRAPEGRTYSHLMVLEESLGSVAWTQLTHEIVAHFEQRELPPVG